MKVATVPTACGIETIVTSSTEQIFTVLLQQYLPLAVLKPSFVMRNTSPSSFVATVPTACGIETCSLNRIEALKLCRVATVPTACGIETADGMTATEIFKSCNSTYRLRY